MKINWKLRLKNKTTLTTLILAVIAIVYKILSLCGIVPAVAQGQVEEIAEMIIFILCILGIVVDPTTEGVSDSVRAMGYTKPYEKIEVKEDDK